MNFQNLFEKTKKKHGEEQPQQKKWLLELGIRLYNKQFVLIA